MQVLKDSNLLYYFAITGGGSSLIPFLAANEGTSKFLTGIEFPYAQEATKAFIGSAPRESYVSYSTARELAVSAWEKQIGLGINPSQAVGVGVTCSLTYNGQREGRENKVFIAFYTKDYVCQSKRVLSGFSRGAQEIEVCSFCCCEINKFVSGISQKEKPETFVKNEGFSDPIVKDGKLIVYSGSFNPAHKAHLKIAEVSKEIVDSDNFIFEISKNAHGKSKLDGIEIEKRVKGLSAPCVITESTTFEEKHQELLKKYPNVSQIIYVMGEDTFDRVGNMGTLDDLENNFSDSFNKSIKFLVFPRGGDWKSFHKKIDGLRNYYLDLNESTIIMRQSISSKMEELSAQIPNISSTQIRKNVH